MADYITTYSGVHFTPTDPDPEGIHIADIAHALSLLCRGNGHLKQFFSIGEHCIRCALEAEARGYSDRMVLACLLHDGGEAYMSDVPRPYKKEMPQYQQWEEQLLSMIYKKYLGSVLTEEEQKLVKQIDDDHLYFDLRDLLNEPMETPEPKMQVKFTYTYMPFEEIEQQYMELFDRFYRKIRKSNCVM